MEVMQAVMERRSVRRFKPNPVPAESLNLVLEAGRWAPSWANTQCCRLILVESAETKKSLADALIQSRPGRPNPATEAVKHAPVVIVALAERKLAGFYRDEKGVPVPSTDKGDWWFMFDVALVMQNMSLVAHSLGLGTIHVGLLDAGRVARILSVPDGFAVVEVMPIGFPDQIPMAPARKERTKFVSRERFGE